MGDNEPSLGSAGSTALSWSYSQIGWAQGSDDDRERENEHDEEGGDEEPALGSTTAINQECAWAAPRGWPVEDGEDRSGEANKLHRRRGAAPPLR